MKINPIFYFILLISNLLFAQGYQGPEQGTVASGVVVTTNSFLKTAPILNPQIKKIRNEIEYEGPAVYDNSLTPISQVNVKNFSDRSLIKNLKSDTAQTILLNNFTGIGMTNSIPPDPNIAVGPNYIVGTVNSKFVIWDKKGNLIKSINADNWFSTTLSNVSSFDPKILYDHFDQRWIMVWLDQDDNSKRGSFLLSVSDNSDPTGTWYNWNLPSNKNGNLSADNWGDYEGVGFNKDAIFITSNQFSFTGSFQYAKIRIIPKAQLYNNTAGEVNWFDLWDIRSPAQNEKIDHIRPSISYSDTSDYYLLAAPNGGGNFVTLMKISNPIDSPYVSIANISVATYKFAPNANQLAGGSPQIETGGSALRNELTFRNGHLWAVHTIQNPKSSLYSSIDYIKIDVNSNQVIENFRFGDNAHWYYYPALAVDKDENVAITYNRSGNDEYVGSFYTTRLKNDPMGFSGSKSLQPGKGNYVVTFSGDRNRWGDYSGIWLDPENEQNIWMLAENASATNSWGTWIGEIRMVPFDSVYAFTNKAELDFGNVESNHSVDTLSFVLSNYGKEDLIISNIDQSIGDFKLINSLNFPITLTSYDSITIKILFSPQSAGTYNQILNISSNDPNFTGITLKANAFQINSAELNTLYACSGILNDGNFVKVDISTGNGQLIGKSTYSGITNIAINPKSKLIYAINSSSVSTDLMRVNSTKGDAYLYHKLDLPDLLTITFDTSGTLYAVQKGGKIFTINISDSSFNLVVDTKVNIAGIAFNPLNNELWGSAYIIIGTNKDKIFKINLATGDTANVGLTGLSVSTNDLAFDNGGNLYGIIGASSQIGSLISIDTSTAQGVIVGSIGFKDITGLDFSNNSIASAAQIDNVVPEKFSLSQNYPNPFNPSTTIEFGIPKAANVKLIIYDLLGKVVKELVNNYRQAGIYKVNWNSHDNNGKNVSSGIYFYELKVSGTNGRELSFMKKMILLK